MTEPSRSRLPQVRARLALWTLALITGISACSGGDPNSEDGGAESNAAAADSSDTANLGSSASTENLSGAELYEMHCARCHATDGSGKSQIKLAIQPRSFMEGGFAWGDTRESIFKVISDGMPGSPFMVPFKHVMTEEQRWLVADHVGTLMPEREAVAEDDRILRVEDNAVVVRGHLSPILEGAPMRPRGMLVGLPGDTTLEYRSDDIRLLGLRAGEFVDRSDWDGRGGSTLKSLGELAHVFADGDPGPTFLDEKGAPLRASLTATHVDGDDVKISYTLEDESGTAVATVDELLRSIDTDAKLGVLRRFEIHSKAGARPIRIALDTATPRDGFAHDEPIESRAGCSLHEDEDGSAVAVVYRSTHDIERVEGDGLVLRCLLGDETVYLLSAVIVADSWTPARLAAWKETLSI